MRGRSSRRSLPPSPPRPHPSLPSPRLTVFSLLAMRPSSAWTRETRVATINPQLIGGPAPPDTSQAPAFKARNLGGEQGVLVKDILEAEKGLKVGLEWRGWKRAVAAKTRAEQ